MVKYNKEKKWYGSVFHFFLFIYQKINMGYIILLIDATQLPLVTLRVT